MKYFVNETSLALLQFYDLAEANVKGILHLCLIGVYSSGFCAY